MSEAVKAVRVDSIRGEGVPDGAYHVDGEGMLYKCPCGCGTIGYLPFKPEPSPSWDFDPETVTLHPSVNWVNHWHGWLKDGFWRAC